jgi:hypothetical protein
MLSNSLIDLAERIKIELAGIRRGLLHALAAGELLTEAKAQLPHGQWESWLATIDLPPRTAQHYMRLAKHADVIKSANVADLTVTYALRMLAPPNPEPEPKPPAARTRGKGLLPLEPDGKRTGNPRYGPGRRFMGNNFAAPAGYRAAKAFLESEGFVIGGRTAFDEGKQRVINAPASVIGAPAIVEFAERVRSHAQRPDPVLTIVYYMNAHGVTIEQLNTYFAGRFLPGSS